MRGRREEILDAALAIADEHGIDAVSMRAVAERVGITPMALYPHVGGKTGLLDGMLGRLLAELTAASGEAVGWRRLLREFAHATRQLAHRHPWAAALLFSRPAVTPEAVGAVDRIYLALLEAGVPASEVPRLERMLSTLIVGYAASESGGRFQRLNPRGRRDLAVGGALPGHEAIAPWLETPADWDAEFEADLEDLECLVETIVARAGYAR
ncbi:TetR/AcrR family transcriptional regulator [Amycolatopsis taiwanensis]|uniref:TetR/AcrR family transcriptional regulator n=1 Tax=Amycolatopsis taiwanensis TaxID=342230 RepID=UPI0004875349|nr:TetR family transcriptional regulator [Amycolatopsis taiwanensis]